MAPRRANRFATLKGIETIAWRSETDSSVDRLNRSKRSGDIFVVTGELDSGPRRASSDMTNDFMVGPPTGKHHVRDFSNAGLPRGECEKARVHTKCSRRVRNTPITHSRGTQKPRLWSHSSQVDGGGFNLQRLVSLYHGPCVILGAFQGLSRGGLLVT